jgi:anti-sigma regulatory factor (Ser/Thr protein kinase)
MGCRTVSVLDLAAEFSEIARLKAWIAQFGSEHQLSRDLVVRLTFCSEELMTNVVMHGDVDSSQNDVRVQLAVEGTETTLTICDRGQPFGPTQVPARQKVDSLEAAPVGGLGLHLVKQYSSGMEYLRRGEINQRVVRFDNTPHQVLEAR